MIKNNSSFGDPKALLAFAVVSLVWGTTFGGIHIGVETIPPALLLCVRFTIAGMILLAICLLKGEHIPSRKDLLQHFIGGALLLVGGNSVVCWAAQHIPTGIGGMLMSATPFWMVALSAIVPPRERTEPMAFLGVLIGFFGMTILLSPQLSKPFAISPVFWLSVFSIVAMTFFWSAGSIYTRKIHSECSTLMGVAWQNIWSGLMFLPLCLLTPETYHVQASTASLLALAHLILLGSIVATPCYFYVLKNTPVSISSTFAYITPLITVLFGWLFLNEEVSTSMLTGMVVILTGVGLTRWANFKKPQPQNLTLNTQNQILLEGSALQ